VLPFRRKGASSTEATVPAPCQVRSETQSPCPNLAVVEIRGVAFCGACAREQEAYFAIGELVAHEERHSIRSERLAEVLKRMRRERVGGRGNATAEVHQGHSEAHETRPLALRNG
jgi:uncharacterized protein YuzB (UPF0349 family)